MIEDFDTVEIELNLAELVLLKDLLRIEAIFQISTEIKRAQDLPNKVSRCFQVFESYRGTDDVMAKIRSDMFKNELEMNKESLPMTHNVKITKNLLNLCKILCTDTPLVGLSENMKARLAKYGPDLIAKIEKAWTEANNKVATFKDVQVNVWGTTASA